MNFKSIAAAVARFMQEAARLLLLQAVVRLGLRLMDKFMTTQTTATAAGEEAV